MASLSLDEIKLYDRQIRLWGFESQQRIQQSKVLVMGLNYLQSEICKNIILAGVNQITIVDWVTVSEANIYPQLFLDPVKSIGKNRALAAKEKLQELNDLVRIVSIGADSEDQAIEIVIENIRAGIFDLVVISGVHSQSSLLKISNSTQNACINDKKNDVSQVKNTKLPLIICQSAGFLAHFFIDLKEHNYIKDNKVLTQIYGTYEKFLNNSMSNLSSPINLLIKVLYEFERKHGNFPQSTSDRIEELVSMKNELLEHYKIDPCKLPDNILVDYLKNFEHEITPISAITGGLIGQEIIKILVVSDPPPFNNFFSFDGNTGKNFVEATE